MSRLQQKIRENLITVISVFSILIIWELLSFLFSSNLILPAPQVVFWETYKLIISTGFFKHISLTILRGLSGLIISFGLSILIGIPAGINNTVFRFFRPYLVLLRSIPVISFILLALIWLKPQHVPVFIAILTMFPILTFSMIDGIKETPQELLEMADIYKVSLKNKIKNIYLPSVTAMLFSGLSNAAGFGWRAIIIGEVLSQPLFGIGSEMHQAQIYLLVPTLIAWTLVAVMISYLFEFFIRFIQKSLLKE